MTAALSHSASADDCHFRRRLHRGEAVRYDDHGAVARHPVQSFLHQCLALSIKGRCCLQAASSSLTPVEQT